MKGALGAANVTFGAKRAEPKDVETYAFQKDPKDFNVYWDVRKGLIPIVGGARETGALPQGTSHLTAALRPVKLFMPWVVRFLSNRSDQCCCFVKVPV